MAISWRKCSKTQQGNCLKANLQFANKWHCAPGGSVRERHANVAGGWREQHVCMRVLVLRVHVCENEQSWFCITLKHTNYRGPWFVFQILTRFVYSATFLLYKIITNSNGLQRNLACSLATTSRLTFQVSICVDFFSHIALFFNWQLLCAVLHIKNLKTHTRISTRKFKRRISDRQVVCCLLSLH